MSVRELLDTCHALQAIAITQKIMDSAPLKNAEVLIAYRKLSIRL